MWQETDLNVYIMSNFTDVRASVNFTSNGELIANRTLIDKPESELLTGDNVVYN